jgi:hypothetical protein
MKVHESFAIIRVEKVKTRQALTQRAKHNDRTKDTPNADPQRFDLNKEYVNLAERSILELLDARTAEAGVGRPRANATLCVEVLFTGGPEAAVWQRSPGKNGQLGPAADMRGSQWETDNVAFAHKEWGKNLLSLKLHQDELTPHFQAFIVPIVGAGGGRNGEVNPKQLLEQLPDGTPARRSARDLFSPQRLARLQTDYAVVVEPHGFKRGINGSRAHHKDMREMYGLLNKTTTEIAPLVEADHVEPYKLIPPSNPLQWSKWLRETEADINARLVASDEKLRLAGQIAVAAAGGNEAAGRSREWVEKEKQHKTGLEGKVVKLESEVKLLEFKLIMEGGTVRELRHQLQAARDKEARLIEKHLAQQDKCILQALQNTLPADVEARAKAQWRAALGKTREEVVKALALPLASESVFNERLARQGYRWEEATANKPRRLVDNQTGVHFPEAKVQPGGEQSLPLGEQIGQAVQATQQAQQQAKQAEMARQQADMRAHQHQQHVANEHWELERFRSERGRDGREVARVRVPVANVTALVESIGRYTAVADEKPGKDGLQGINLSYYPSAGSNGMRVSDFLDKAKELGGEVYELADARATRELYAASDRQLAANYSVEKSQQITR